MTLQTKPNPAGHGVSRKPSTAELLKSASKKATSTKSDAFIYDGDLSQPAGRFLDLLRQKDEAERELELLRGQIRESLDPWYAEQLTTHAHESGVRIRTGGRTLRATYQHRYVKLPADKESHIREIVNGKFEQFFKMCAGLKVRKDVSDNPEMLDELIGNLASLMGPEAFAATFESELTIAPTKAFTERRYTELSSEDNCALGLAGVRQVVVLAEGK